MSQKLWRIIALAASAVVLSAVIAIGGVPNTASATQLPNDWNALNCSWFKHSPRQVIQACADIGPFGPSSPDHWNARADITAYKENGGTVTRDNSINVSFEMVTTYANGVKVSAASSYPTGPIAGYASGSTRIPGGNYYDIAGKQVKVTATFAVWKNGSKIKTYTVDSRTITGPSSD